MGIIRRTWGFLKEDSWQSWIVTLILVVVVIKFILFPSLAWITGAPLPLVVIESCSMYHNSGFEEWWNANGLWYEDRGITKEEFMEYPFKNGLNKGDIILLWGKSARSEGDVIIFNAEIKYPIIHRMVSEDPLETKGDNNADQLSLEKGIPENAVIGEAVGRVPLIGWVKLIFFEFGRDSSERGLCK